MLIMYSHLSRYLLQISLERLCSINGTLFIRYPLLTGQLRDDTRINDESTFRELVIGQITFTRMALRNDVSAVRVMFPQHIEGLLRRARRGDRNETASIGLLWVLSSEEQDARDIAHVDAGAATTQVLRRLARQCIPNTSYGVVEL